MNRFEIYGEGTLEAFLERVRLQLLAHGFVEGPSTRTPRNLLLVPRPPRRRPYFLPFPRK